MGAGARALPHSYIRQQAGSFRGECCRFFLNLNLQRLACISTSTVSEIATCARAAELCQNLRTARKRRRIRQSELAKNAGIGEKTIRRLEKGDGGVAVGPVLSVLWTLGLLPTAKALANLETDDHGKTLELTRLPQRVRRHPPDNDF